MVDLIKSKSTAKDEVCQDPALIAESYVEPVLKNDVNKLVIKDETCDQIVLKVEGKDETILKATTTQGISPKPTMSTSVSYYLSDGTRPELDIFTSECPERCGITKLVSVLFALLLILVLVFTVRTRRSRVTRTPAI